MMPGIRTLAFSARIQRGAGTLIGALRDAVAELEQKHDPLWLGRGWIAVRDELRRRVQQEQARTLEYREFERLCHTIGGVSSPGVLMWYLHAAGVVFYSPSLFGGKVILDQSWALEAVYTVFDRERTLPFLRGDGSFTRSDLDRLVWGKIRQEEGKEAFSESEQKLFLSMMESCGICFRLRRNTQGETVWVAPEILPPRSAVQDHLAGRLRESDLPNRRIVFCYRFLHEGIVRGFLCAIGGRAHDAAVYWRNGMWLYERKTDAYAVVEARHGCEESMPGSGVIECLVYGDRSEQLVSMLKGVIARLNPSPFGVQESEPYSTSHPNAPLESIRSEPSSSFNFASNAPVPSGARPAVFISYAWPDNTPAGVQRGEVVERLCSRLDQVGFRVMRDCLVIHNGDSIRAFMKNFGSADHVVAVISDKYLRSPNCMFELHSIWQSSNGDPERFRQRVHPLILEDANVGTIDLRLDRADHWLKVKRSLEGRLSDLGAAFGEENYRQFRLISEFAHHVADMLAWLNDVLMPRGFGQICANDFHEVVELLRIKTNLPASSGNRPLG